jgi:hypothetical protein
VTARPPSGGLFAALPHDGAETDFLLEKSGTLRTLCGIVSKAGTVLAHPSLEKLLIYSLSRADPAGTSHFCHDFLASCCKTAISPL